MNSVKQLMISTVASLRLVLKKALSVSKLICLQKTKDIEKLEAFARRTRSKSKLMTMRLDRWITASIYIQNKEETHGFRSDS